jgi:hypothetical protein
MKAIFFLNILMCTFFACSMELDSRNHSPVRNSSPTNNSPSKSNSRITITNSTEALGVPRGTRKRSSEVTPSTRRTNSFSENSSLIKTHASVVKVRISAESLQLKTEEAIFKNVQGQLLKIANK